MKHTFKTLAFALGLILTTQSAIAKKLLIVTDQPGGAKAREIQHLFQTTTPFKLLKASEFTVEVKILDSSSKPIKCYPTVLKYTDKEIESMKYWSAKNGMPLSDDQVQKYKKGFVIERLTTCDKQALAALGAQFQADRMIFVHDSPVMGGSGGDIPIILSGSGSGIGMHEFLHAYGLADEYAYPKDEAPFYCGQHQWANVAIFQEQPPYRSSDDVRVRHAAQIPFLPYISKSAELITGEHLGSPKAGNLGIFPSKTCSNVVPALQSWKSSSNPTIMEDPYSTYIPKPYWPTILSGLGVSRNRIDSLMLTAVAPTWNPVRPVIPPPPVMIQPLPPGAH
jgi:hypothetical protein